MTFIPLDVPKQAQSDFIENYESITRGTNRLMLFAADQKIEHLNKDFHGPFIHPDANHPEHVFNIASNGKIGAMATQLGLIARYGHNHKNVNYIVKLNSKTNLVDVEQKEPLNTLLWSIDDVLNFKKNSGLKIRGVGYTVYIGSEYESQMLQQAAEIVLQAHQNGLIAILWVYARGKSVSEKSDLELTPGLTGIANALGADFVKIKAPRSTQDVITDEILKLASKAAGNTKIICSGGEPKPTESFLKDLYEQINMGGTCGNATGRNIFQRSLPDAIAFTNAISAIVYENKSIHEAIDIYQSMMK